MPRTARSNGLQPTTPRRRGATPINTGNLTLVSRISVDSALNT